MSYVRSRPALGVTREQQTMLLEVSPEELQELPAEVRLNLVLRRQEIKAAESQAFWQAVATAVTVLVPVAALLGISMAKKKQ